MLRHLVARIWSMDTSLELVANPGDPHGLSESRVHVRVYITIDLKAQDTGYYN